MAKVNPCICFTYDLLYFTYGIFALQEGLHFMPKILVKNRACLFSLSLHLPSTWLWYALIMFPSSMSCSHVVELSKGGPVGYLWLFRAGFLICGEIRIAYPDFPCPNYSNFSWQTLNGPAVTCKTFSYKLQPRVSNQNGNPHKHTHTTTRSKTNKPNQEQTTTWATTAQTAMVIRTRIAWATVLVYTTTTETWKHIHYIKYIYM